MAGFVINDESPEIKWRREILLSVARHGVAIVPRRGIVLPPRQGRRVRARNPSVSRVRQTATPMAIDV